MSDGREERKEREMRIEDEKRQDRGDLVSYDELDDSQPERPES